MPALRIYLSKFLSACLFMALLASCSGRKLTPSQIVSISDYVDGVAVAKVKELDFSYSGDFYYFVDEDLRVVEPGLRLREISEFIDGYAVAVSNVKTGENSFESARHIFNRKGQPILTANYDESLFLVPGGKAWRPGGRGMQFVNLADTSVILEERLWGLEVTPSGTSLLKRTRSDRHADPDGNVNLMEYMLLDRNGRILIPWGRISYIADFSNGMARASNSIRSGYRWHVDEVSRYTAPGYSYGTYGYIDEQGRWRVPEQYGQAEDFNEAGYARVASRPYSYGERTQWKYIDRTGRVLQGAEADAARRSFNNR